MTPQEKAANVAMLARVVMKWTLEPLRDGFRVCLPDGCLLFIGESRTMLHRWDPYASIADAMEMLDRFDRWVFLCDTGGHACALNVCTVTNWPPREESGCEAICAACLEWAKAQPPAPEPEQVRVEGDK